MKLSALSLSAVGMACAALMFASCSTTVVHRTPGRKIGNGPPPHAPAHGRRHKQADGIELVFDSGRGVYVVVGLEEHYYFDDHYYRFCNGQWEVSVRIDGGWKPAFKESLPPGLRRKDKGKHVSKVHPGRGYGLQKKNW